MSINAMGKHADSFQNLAMLVQALRDYFPRFGVFQYEMTFRKDPANPYGLDGAIPELLLHIGQMGDSPHLRKSVDLLYEELTQTAHRMTKREFGLTGGKEVPILKPHYKAVQDLYARGLSVKAILRWLVSVTREEAEEAIRATGVKDPIWDASNDEYLEEFRRADW